MIKERRKHPRLRIPLEAEYLVAGEEEWRQGTIWTLGAGGAGLLCEQKLDRGTVLEGVHFVVEAEGDLPETRIEVSAEVVSVDRKDDFGRTSNFMLGLQFTGLGEQEFEILKQFVFRRLTNPKRPSATDQAEPGEKAAAPPLEIRFKLFDEFVEEVSENLSPSGMFIRAHRPLPPGSRFVFQFQLGEDFSLFQGTAEVVWTRRRREGPERPSGMGVRFLNLDLTSQKMVKRLVGETETETETESEPGEAVDEPKRKKKATLDLSAVAEPFAIVTATDAGKAPAATEEGAPVESPAGKARTSERVAELEKRLGHMESARDEAEERVLRIAAKAEELREEVRTLQSTRDEADEARKRSEAVFAEVEEARGRAEDQVAELEESRSRAEAKAAKAEEARGRAETEAAELRRELKTLEPDDDLEEKLGQAREELQSRQKEWQSLEADLRAELERDAGSRSELQEELEDAGTREAELRRRLESAGETEADLRAELQQMEEGRDELERLAEKASDAEDRLQLMRQELADSRREWDATESELRAQLDQHRAEKSELEDRITESAGAEAELRQRLSEVRGAHDELAERLAQGAEVESVLREQAREFRQGRDESVAKLARATEQLVRLRGAAEEMKSRFNGDLSAAQELGVDLAKKLAEVAEVGSGLDRKVESLSAARADLAVRLSRINEAWSSLEGGLGAVEADESDLTLESAAPLMFASTTSADEEAQPLEEAASTDKLDSVEESLEAAATERQDAPEEGPRDSPDAEPDVAVEGEPDLAPAVEAAEVETLVAEPMETSASVPEEPPAEAAELAEPTAGSESAREQEAVEEAPPVPTGAARLVGVAKRAVARLGFARKSSEDAHGSWFESESEVPILEAKTEAVVADEEPSPVAIEETVRAWAAAWSEQRVEDYLSFYSQEFEPVHPDDEEESGDASHAWLPPLTGMQLTLGPISQTEMAPGRFAVQFEQSVESDSYTRRTGRTLEMVLEADAWKIAAESFQDLPN